MIQTALTVLTFATGLIGVYAHPVPHPDPAHPRASLSDYAGKLMSQHRARRAVRGSLSPFIDVDIRSAHAACLHLDEHLPFPHSRDGPVLYRQLFCPPKNRTLHLNRLLSSAPVQFAPPHHPSFPPSCQPKSTLSAENPGVFPLWARAGAAPVDFSPGACYHRTAVKRHTMKRERKSCLLKHWCNSVFAR